MKNSISKIAAAVSVATMAGSAQAGIVTASISLSELLSNGAGYAGTFALSPLLAANGLSGGTFNSATLTAYGFSDTQIDQYAYTGYNEHYLGGYSTSIVIGSYSYSCGSWLNRRTCYSNYYGYAHYGNYDAYQHSESRDTVADSMLLTSGAASASDTVDRTRSGATVSYQGSYNRSNGTYGRDTVFSYNSHTSDVMSGALYAELGLGANDLLNLAKTGQFDFMVAATVGNFRLHGLTMTVDVTAKAADPAEVPEPASALLMLGGLAGLAAAARRQRRERAQS
ncbi:VPLPA-CTERM sorting domain-containing protein [Massilia sp. PAMC28688]|uniref:VPLPA-CTERM sorting domain-containing protein n=1 Tax=Massilia sp. PAMC28688 TaxID=2861283 RepID=UPI001C6343F7|nr:VPLPA-CTERM sorting domain-containing protein [Massilia sp. PAMC28688]QYF93721.1 VPLPA-CTERM sorting domain-containing protein [Massilia sp. PAMC28688]